MRHTKNLLITTALVAAGSLWTTGTQADSSMMSGLQGLPIAWGGLSQVDKLDRMLNPAGSDDPVYWRPYGSNFGPGSYNNYGWESYHRYESEYRSYQHSYDDDDGIIRAQPADFETEEFRNSPAAAQSNAHFVYAEGAEGRAITVAVVDEQFDINHFDLRDNIVDFKDFTADQRRAADGADAVTETVFELAEENLITDHGTQVTGVIAATRNGQGILGVAPGASILAIRTDTIEVEELDPSDIDEDTAGQIVDALNQGASFIVSDGEQVQFFQPDDQAEVENALSGVQTGELRFFSAQTGFGDDDRNAQGIDYAVANGADIINLSQGGTEPDEPGRQAILNAVRNGVIVVAAAGNTAGANPDFPARFAADPKFNDLVLAVGAIDANKNIADTSERCGVARENCLVAPGVQVTTTATGDKFEKVDGTSFAAPAVSGGLALLMDLFPTLLPEEAVQLILRTADDLGEEGVDDVFGHGALNLERAVQPVGVASLPTGTQIRGDVVRLSDSRLGLGDAFGDSFTRTVALQQSFFLDEFRRPFKADLSQQVVVKDRGISFEGVLGGSDIETQTFVNPDGYQVTLALTDDSRDAAFGAAQQAFEEETQLQSVQLSGEVMPGLAISSGLNLTAIQQLTTDPASEATKGLFLFEGDAVNPQHDFLGKGNGLSLTQSLTDKDSLTVGVHLAGEQIGNRRGEGRTVQADLKRRFENGAALGFSASFTQEGEGFLGSEASGAFAASAETENQFYTLSGKVPLVADLEAFGSATVGLSDLSGVQGGLLADLDRTTSSAFALGVVKTGVFRDKDRIGLRFSQPIRVEGGADAELLVPTSVNSDGSIVQSTETISLQPSGRELNLQLAHTQQLANSINLTNYALARSEPGHNADAKPDFGVGVRFNWRF